jgi:hypothetical protein
MANIDEPHGLFVQRRAAWWRNVSTPSACMGKVSLRCSFDFFLGEGGHEAWNLPHCD